MIPAISPEDAETFARDGIVCMRNMFDPAWVADLQSLAEIIRGLLLAARARVGLGPQFAAFHVRWCSAPGISRHSDP